MSAVRTSSLLLAALLGACAARPPAPRMQRVHLPEEGVGGIAAAFAAANPGYAIEWRPSARELEPDASPRIVFVQSGSGTEVSFDDDPEAVSVRRGMRGAVVGTGDLLVLRRNEGADFGTPVDLLVFRLPAAPSTDVPAVVRPDHDPRITDTPGGCATDDKAYRRVLLTWLDKNGPYTFEGLNAHRVRIDDSFTHYHPVEGGFDELYLVQAVRPGAVLITCERVDALLHPESLRREETGSLLRTTPLRAGDLIYLPRGVVHRGLGGVLAQVVTVPGFVPGAEIGVDHHLRAINERFGLAGADALPLHAAAAGAPVVR